MKAIELYEKRRNPEVNKKIYLRDIILKYKDNPNIYIHSTNIKKIGFNPRYDDGNDTPFGIYAFNLSKIFKRNKSLDISDMSDEDILEEWLDYSGGNYIFFLESNIKQNTNDTYTSADYEKDKDKLYQEYGNIVYEHERNVKHDLIGTHPAPITFLYELTKKLSTPVRDGFDHYIAPNAKKWMKILKSLGFNYLDDNGNPQPFIYGHDEPIQTVFFDSSLISVVDFYSMYNHVKQTINDRPVRHKKKKIHLDTIVKGTFSNSYFQDVSFITVENMDITSIKYIMSAILNGTTKIYFKNLNIDCGDDSDFVSNVINGNSTPVGGLKLSSISKMLGPNTKIDNLYLNNLSTKNHDLILDYVNNELLKYIGDKHINIKY